MMINSSLRLTTITIFCCILFTIACGSDNDKPSTTITKPQSQATEEVIQKGGQAKIHLGRGNVIPIENLAWILLDEYQDFSELVIRQAS